MLGAEGWTFAVQAARAYLDALETPVHRLSDGTLELGSHRAKFGQTDDFFIRFMGGPSTIPMVSFVDVLRGAVPPSHFTDKIVLVGATSLDLQDFRVTPFRGAMAGVEVQANAIATILSGRSHHRLAPVSVIGLMLAILLWWTGLLLALRVWRQLAAQRRAVAISLAGSFTVVAIIVSAVLAFHWLVVVDVVPLLATGAGQVVTSLIAGYVFAERRLEFQRENIEALYRMGDETREGASLDRLTDLLFAQARHLLGVDRLALELWTAEDALTRDWQSRPADKNPLPIPAPLYNELATRVRSTGLPVSATDLVLADRTPETRSPRASLFVPLVAHNRVIGILQVHRERPIPFHEGEAKTLLTLATQAALNIENSRLLDDVRRLFHRSLEAFSTALDFKDNDTGGHSQRVSLCAREVALRMGIAGDALEHIAQGALLHDIGKIAVPDSILRKPGTLSDEEWATMRRHPDTGFQMLKAIHVPDEIARVVRQHHEKYDGTGYPLGLRGTDITVGARIFSVVDFYDALSSDRPYRKAMPFDQVVDQMRQETGRYFDPEVLDTFLAIPEETLRAMREDAQDRLRNDHAA
jgi:putative nucleotidyltransferase with HDIG domain